MEKANDEKKASGRKGREDGIICAQSPVAWASPAERWKKKPSESGFFTCHTICAKNCLFPGVYKIDKRVKNDGERAREIEIVN